MGGIHAKSMAEYVEESSPVINHSREHAITEWDLFNPKNVDYYYRKPTVIPIEFYQTKLKGWLWV